ncbi:MAG: peptide-methionine (S)-S-oxide reductase MsrA [Kiritimatiellae bacterium]|nr:peptide-methionine (S)-S-oxide reductase MsrA [Kiritimatiellia bacterium]
MKANWIAAAGAALVATNLAAADTKGKTMTETATFGAGCFWCVEAVFEQVPGVRSVVSGYTGGHVPSPTYKQVCSGRTGHAEAVQIEFDPAVVSYGELLAIFWRVHDPTALNRQGADIGTQYRSAIFYHSEAQRGAAEASRAAAEKEGLYAAPIVTEIVPASDFYKAEGYHQDYYENNSSAPYCRVVITPKLRKLKKLLKTR